MRKVVLQRAYEKLGSTIGILNIEGQDHLPIFTLEDSWLNNEPYESCIPAGKYIVKWHKSPKYGWCYKVQDVKDRTHILIHTGNTNKDTLGCILPGLGAGKLKGVPAVLNSRAALKWFEEVMGKEDFKLEIIKIGGSKDDAKY